MGLYNWLFGDPREVLARGEEWETPEEWFVDTDGKRVRRKKKRKCCGCTCEPETQMVMELPIAAIAVFADDLPDAEDVEVDTPLEPLADKDKPTVADELVAGLNQFVDDLKNDRPIEVTVVQIVEVPVVVDSVPCASTDCCSSTGSSVGGSD